MISILLITLLLLANEASVKAAPPPPSDVICPADADMYKECRASICSLIRASPEKGPTFVRLAWHASGTYTKMTNKGGSYNGTIRFYEEFSRGANNGLQTAMGWLNEIWLYNNRDGKQMTYADLYSLAGAEAISCMYGPYIPWRYGRVDSVNRLDVPDNGLLPMPFVNKNTNDTASALRSKFYRMGFNDKDIVSLSGAHSIGRCHNGISGYNGTWSPTPFVFSNKYFVLLNRFTWKTDVVLKDNSQYTDTENLGFFMLPSDVALKLDPVLNVHVKNYAANETLFFQDFVTSYVRVLEQGCVNLRDTV